MMLRSSAWSSKLRWLPDQTVNSGIGRIRRYLDEEEASKYLGGDYRCRIINVWRPINRPSQDCPLTWCAAHTIGEGNLVPVDRYNPEFVLELYYLKYSPKQEWYWVKDQKPEEVAIFCQFDSTGVDHSKPFHPHIIIRDYTNSNGSMSSYGISRFQCTQGLWS